MDQNPDMRSFLTPNRQALHFTPIPGRRWSRTWTFEDYVGQATKFETAVKIGLHHIPEELRSPSSAECDTQSIADRLRGPWEIDPLKSSLSKEHLRERWAEQENDCSRSHPTLGAPDAKRSGPPSDLEPSGPIVGGKRRSKLVFGVTFVKHLQRLIHVRWVVTLHSRERKP